MTIIIRDKDGIIVCWHMQAYYWLEEVFLLCRIVLGYFFFFALLSFLEDYRKIFIGKYIWVAFNVISKFLVGVAV